MSDIGSKIIQAVRDVAALYPGYVFEGGCCYVHNGQPACIIGHALWNLGIINSEFEKCGINFDCVSNLATHFALALDNDELNWLSEVQEQQDTHNTWARSVVIADLIAEASLL